MKKNLLLSSLLLAVLASGAAAQTSDQSEPMVLPTYVVEADRQATTPADDVNRSLDELRAQANTPVVVSVELPALKARVAQSAKSLGAARLAKS